MTHLGHHHGCMINYMSTSKNFFRIASILIIKLYRGASTKDEKILMMAIVFILIKCTLYVASKNGFFIQ